MAVASVATTWRTDHLGVAAGNSQRDATAGAMTDSPRSPGLIERYQEELQVRHYARRTVSTYTQ